MVSNTCCLKCYLWMLSPPRCHRRKKESIFLLSANLAMYARGLQLEEWAAGTASDLCSNSECSDDSQTMRSHSTKKLNHEFGKVLGGFVHQTMMNIQTWTSRKVQHDILLEKKENKFSWQPYTDQGSLSLSLQ